MAQRQFWLGTHRAGQVGRIWADCDLIHVLIGGTRIKTVRPLTVSSGRSGRADFACSGRVARPRIRIGHIARSGFHPLDGAEYLLELDAPQRFVDLVAHHSGAAIKARIRGLQHELSHITDEKTPLRDALWYCDLTTGPDGQRLSAGERLEEIRQRYGSSHIVTRFINEAANELLSAVDRTKHRLEASK